MTDVRIWEEAVVIPTYEVGKPDPNPMFLEKRVYQGSSGKIYPYPATYEISRTKKDKTYKAVFLENEYLKIMILPELGGRIQRAVDKVSGQDFIYYNHVIKPALVGLLGPWISGGIEFNWPQHHRPTTFMPVSYELQDNADGSKTLVTGDIDRMYGTRETTEFTLYPGKAYIDIKGQLYNGTPLPQTFLWWANPAVSVNDNTQSVFPPDVHNVYDHGKRAVSTFPIATGEYYKHDYSAGVDISRYRNIPVPTSYMAEKSDYDFVGGYDYGTCEGLLHVADHHISPGKKQWTWGCGDFGKAWDRNLTDSDGPYIELMTGMFCDNQPDFSWLMPYEEKTFHQYFMPYRKAGYVRNATRNACINVRPSDDGKSLHLVVYATSLHEQAAIRLSCAGHELINETALLSPRDVYEKDIPMPSEYTEGSGLLKAEVLDENGSILVSYHELKNENAPIAEPLKAPARPEDIASLEELYLIGQHIEQYRHATWLPDPYYLEGLKRDKNDSRINTAYGYLLLRRSLYSEAEEHFKTAIARITMMTPNPMSSDAYYGLGLSLFYQNKKDEAYDAFYKATWSASQAEKSWYFLALIAGGRGDFEEALSFVDKSLVRNAHNVKALALKAALLLKSNRREEALRQVEYNLTIDNFDFTSRFLGCICRESENNDSISISFQGKDDKSKDYDEITKESDDIQVLSAGNFMNYLQSARDMIDAGMTDYALSILKWCPCEQPIKYYYMAYCETNEEDAAKYLKTAEEVHSPDDAPFFPDSNSDIPVLKYAIEHNPDGHRAYLLLGELLYDRLQYSSAARLWQVAENLCPEDATVKRCLATALFNKDGHPELALQKMEEAFKLSPHDATLFLELDQLREKRNIPVAERLGSFREHMDLVNRRDDIYTVYVTLLNLSGLYDEALQAIRAHDFQTWEGAEGKISTQFKTSLVQLARHELEKGNLPAAADYIREALSYPHNLGEGRLEGTRDNDLHYLMGEILEAQGDEGSAEEYRLATLGDSDPAGVLYYYDQPADMILFQGLAFRKLGNEEEAVSRFNKLIRYGIEHQDDTMQMDYFAVSLPDLTIFDTDYTVENRAHCAYLQGLGNLGLGKNDDASAFFDKAISLKPTHQRAIMYRELSECKLTI